ncbi:metallophosphoesterase [Pontibacter silvestris]|uniref:Metallophosphoesterase n=1 Tax=Pontibacter silvestris TaxID=2305183 RepID=A0ABW4WVX2_9BACT|nr:metallophosphoesterase [Pontibacter silvestris]MCC9137996.1 metallophosphoesterase [Pontibacter silvestris]
MLTYFLIIVPTLISVFLIFNYWQERKYRRKPYYKLADVGWQRITPPKNAQLVHSVALIGDIGAVATDGTDPVLHLFKQWQQQAGANGTAVFLGDNLYPIGLPPEGSKYRAAAEERLNLLTQMLKSYSGKGIFLSGNHDWFKGRKGGYQQMLRQEKFIVEKLQDENSYLPRNGCPGPVPIQIAEGLLMVVINTQWWVHRGIRPLGKEYNCPYSDIEQFFLDLNTLLRKNQHQRILIVAHHPLYSNAMHGGKFTIKQHIFPLTAAHKRFYIPLPIFGSAYPFYRKMFGAYEDMAHGKYKKMRKRFLQIFHRYSNIIYVAGHDHNLQHFEIRRNHYIVSGSGSKTAFVKKGGKATFTVEQLGFVVLNYYDNGQVWIEVQAVSEEDKAGKIIFRKELKSILKPNVAQEEMI